MCTSSSAWSPKTPDRRGLAKSAAQAWFVPSNGAQALDPLLVTGQVPFLSQPWGFALYRMVFTAAALLLCALAAAAQTPTNLSPQQLQQMLLQNPDLVRQRLLQ